MNALESEDQRKQAFTALSNFEVIKDGDTEAR
jgi:hypothetical protein